MPQTIPTEAIPDVDPFMQWVSLIDAARGFHVLVAAAFCPFCELPGLTASWLDGSLILSCACMAGSEARCPKTATPSSPR